MEKNEQQDSPRLRFAKREIDKALRALEAVDHEQLDFAMRCLELEDQIADLREELGRVREGRDVMSRILAATGDERGKLLDRALRHYGAEA